MNRIFVIAAASAALAASAAAAAPVTTGVVVRGLSIAIPVGAAAGAPNTPVAPQRNCMNFTREDVDIHGRMTGASVQCRAGGSAQTTVPGLPPTFNAYCMVDAKKAKSEGGHLITAAMPGNANHCDLSGIKPKAAANLFGQAYWR
jgi:hypothetical protein